MVLPPDEAVDLLRKRLTILDSSARDARDVLAAASDVAWVFLIDDEYRLGARVPLRHRRRWATRRHRSPVQHEDRD